MGGDSANYQKYMQGTGAIRHAENMAPDSIRCNTTACIQAWKKVQLDIYKQWVPAKYQSYAEKPSEQRAQEEEKKLAKDNEKSDSKSDDALGPVTLNAVKRQGDATDPTLRGATLLATQTTQQSPNFALFGIG